MTPADIVKTVREFGPVWGVAIVLATIAALFGRLRWKSSGQSIEALLRDPVFLAAAAGAAIAFAAYVPVYHLLVGRKRGLPEPFARDEIGILVASVPGDTERKTQQTYVQSIRAVLAKAGATQTRVRLIQRQLPNDPDRQHAEALRIGRRLRASFVLRAIPIEAGYQVWVSNIDLPEFELVEAHLGKVTDRQLAEIETLALPSQVGQLAHCALALSYYRSERFRKAADILRALADGGELPVGSPHRPHLMVMLGNCLVNDRYHDPASVLPAAIAAYDEALRLWSRETQATQWADAMINRGVAYMLLPGPVVSTNVKESDRCFALALDVFSRQSNPERWARVTALRAGAQLAAPEPDLGRSIRAFDEALEVIDRRKNPYLWAAVMTSRAFALGRTQTDDAFREALKSYALAFQVLDRVRHPYEWADAVVKRASTYIGDPFLSNIDVFKFEEFERATEALDEAEEVFMRQSHPLEWAGLRTVSAILLFLAHGADHDLGEQSLQLFDQALEVVDPERYPVQCARTHDGRGVAYATIGGADPVGRFREAIRSHGLAAAIYERQGMHEDARNSRSLVADAERKLAALR